MHSAPLMVHAAQGDGGDESCLKLRSCQRGEQP